MTKARESKKLIVAAVIFGGILCLSVYFLARFTQNREKTEITKKEGLPLPVESGQESLPQEEPQLTSPRPIRTLFMPDETARTDKEIIDLIESLKSDDFPTSRKAADKLASLGKEAVPALLDTLPESSVALKGQIIFLLGRIKDKSATPLLMEMLNDDNAYIRRNAAEALGKIEDNQALYSLTSALLDDDTSVKERSAWALGQLHDAEAVEDLLNILNFEKEERVKSAVVGALAKLKDGGATLTLLDELKAVNDQLYKNLVVAALGEIGDSRALEDLIKYVDELREYKPAEKMFIYQWEESIKIAQEAIEKIQKNNEY